MNCCHVQTRPKPQRNWWRRASGSVGSGALLVLLPKCPMCIAAHLAVWTGASVAMPVATHLRPLLEIVLTASAVLLLVPHLTTRAHSLYDNAISQRRRGTAASSRLTFNCGSEGSSRNGSLRAASRQTS